MTDRRRRHRLAFLVLVLVATLAFPTMAFASQAAAAGAERSRSPRPPCRQRRRRCSLRPRHLGVVRRDDRSRRPGCRPTACRPTGRRASRPRPPTSAPTCGARSSPSSSGSSATPRPSRGSTGRCTRSRRWSATSRAASTTTGTTTHTGAKLTIWPPTGAPLTPILSSVDNGWLATGLHVVANSVPEVADARPGALRQHGLRLLLPARRSTGSRFHVAPDTGDSPCCYDTIVSESRIASYIGIAKGELPAKEYFGAWRTFPDTCDWSWQETKPVGVPTRDATYGV